ncbi:MAG: hypothetical protein RLZZ271_132 [Pseudomonadota bacterium]|jgi:peptidyl-prolyl cis-trans isomerase C
MSAATTQSHCGQSDCGCHSATSEPVARVNAVTLHEEGERLSADELRVRAITELLRQQAVATGRLAASDASIWSPPDTTQQKAIERLLDEEVPTPEVTREACERYYEANKLQFIVGQNAHVRHILFAVTPGVDVHALAQRAEQALLELLRKGSAPGRFAELARELSNCPSGAEGGDLGTIGPDDCAPELANELFFQTNAGWGMGLRPRLVHTRYGFHIIDVLGRKKGRQLAFADVHERIANQMSNQSRSTALRQYVLLLAGAARIEGVDIEASASPLVQ